jgi:Protein of unknown function (DUF1559)
VREAAARVQCQNNLKQIGLALHGHHDVHGHLPRGVAFATNLSYEQRCSWLTALLPYLEQDALAKQIQQALPWDAEENRSAVNRVIPVFRCPAHPDATAQPHAHYVGLTGIGADAALLPLDSPRAGFFGYERQITLRDIRDGTSQTAAVIETAAANGPWASGGEATLRFASPTETAYLQDTGPFGMKHKTDTFFRTNPIVANTAFADGSVHCLPSTLSPTVFRAMVTIAGQDDAGMEF